MKNKKSVKIAALSLAVCSLSSAMAPVGAFALKKNQSLSPEQLAKEYSQEELAAFSPEQREQIIAFQKHNNEHQYYVELNKVCASGDGPTPALEARGTTMVVNKAYESLAKSAKAFLPFFAISMIAKNGGDILDQLRNLYASISVAVKSTFYKLTAKGIKLNKYQKTLDRIEKRLRAELVGQDEAIDKIIAHMAGYFESMNEAKYLGQKFEGGLVFYLTGMPATGKSTTMKIIQEEMGLKSCVCRMSDAVEDKGNGAATVAARLLKPIVLDNGRVKNKVDTPLARQIKNKIPTLYCFDEIDKMRQLDSKIQKRDLKDVNGKIIGSSVDEMLRNFGDTGQINGIDASGSILIATSNETDSQLLQLESSLYNRYKGCVVNFKDFDSKDYREIIERNSQSIKELYKNKYNIKVVFNESLISYYSEKYEKENTGARGVDSLMNESRYVLKTYINKNYKSNLKGKTFSVNYDKNTNRLYVESL